MCTVYVQLLAKLKFNSSEQRSTKLTLSEGHPKAVDADALASSVTVVDKSIISL